MIERVCREMLEFIKHPCDFIDQNPAKGIVYAVALNVFAFFITPFSTLLAITFHALTCYAYLALIIKCDVVYDVIIGNLFEKSVKENEAALKKFDASLEAFGNDVERAFSPFEKI